ncbi:MAG: TPM domain-containing protein [Schleiferiaceae bacterium]|nr:TPM domain-containing protein [Schleiferiaceae bacterium]
MSDYIRTLLSEKQEQALVHAISQAELHTSGEIRIHLEKSIGNSSAQQRAKKWFGKLEMHKTAEKNGVLFYLAIKDRKLAIWAGEGINAKVPANFWQEIINLIIAEFKVEHFSEGLIAGVEKTGQALGEFFPRQDDDIDELSNEISKG